MALEIKGWLPLKAAADYLGVDYETARQMVQERVFTRGRFTSEKPTAPIYLSVEEMDAWKRAGVDGVRSVQAANKAELESLTSPTLGEAGA